MSISLEKAIELLVENVWPVEAETLPLSAALGRVLAEPVFARLDQPPFDRSPLDGYALRAEDSTDALPESPVTLRVAGKLCAGDACDFRLAPGEAARVMTGAMLPAGADCVIRQEDTDYGETAVRIFRRQRVDNNFVRRGEDFRAGELLIPSGTRLDAAALAIAASGGAEHVSVHRRVRVAVFSTGDELVQPGTALTAGKIYDSNLRYLTARLAELGAEVRRAVPLGDDQALIQRELKQAAEWADLVLTTGGVSVGQRDLLPLAARELAGKPVFHGIAMKPGSPALFFRLDKAAVLCLSGNPFAAAATFELLARPLLAILSGDPEAGLCRVEAELTNEFHKHSPARRLIRARCLGGYVTVPEGHSSGQLRSLLGCNCLIDIPAGSKGLYKGDRVSVLLF